MAHPRARWNHSMGHHGPSATKLSGVEATPRNDNTARSTTPSPLLQQRRKRRVASRRRTVGRQTLLMSSSVLLLLILLMTTIVWTTTRVQRIHNPETTPLQLRRTATALPDTTNRISSVEEPGHVIPHRIVMTHKYNLLLETMTASRWLGANTTRDEKDREELTALQRNVHAIQQLHPDCTLEFWTNNDCREEIRNMAYTPQQATEWVQHFDREPKGMFQADWCRGAALYPKGGVYFDVDLGVRGNVFDYLQDNTTFATVQVHAASEHHGAFFQAFIAVQPRHPVIRRYIDLFGEYYDRTVRDPHAKIEGPLGVLFLKQAWDEIVSKQPVWNETMELWHEVLYRDELRPYFAKDFVPPDTSHKRRRACKFVVVSSLRELPLKVPLYSRITGSRICPAIPQNTHAKWNATRNEPDDKGHNRELANTSKITNN